MKQNTVEELQVSYDNEIVKIKELYRDIDKLYDKIEIMKQGCREIRMEMEEVKEGDK